MEEGNTREGEEEYMTSSPVPPPLRHVTCIEVPDEDHKDGEEQINDSNEEAAAPPSRKGVFIFPPTLDEVHTAYLDLIGLLNPPQKKG